MSEADEHQAQYPPQVRNTEDRMRHAGEYANQKRHRNVRDARKTAQFLILFFINGNEEINTDEILIGNFIHDRSRRNCLYLHMIEHPQYTDY